MSNRQLSYGYNLPSETRFNVENFCFSLDGDPLDSEETTPAWNYYTDTSISAELEVDLPGVLEDLGILNRDRDAVELGAVISWYSHKTKQRGASTAISLKDGVNNLKLPPIERPISGKLEACVKVFLVRNDALQEVDFAPTRFGSFLWESDKWALDLEGEGAEFPTIPLDFAKNGINPSKALWKIEFRGSSLKDPAQNAVCVYLNSRDERILNMLNHPKSQAAIYCNKFLEVDVLAHLLLWGADHAEEVEGFEREKDDNLGSIGESILIMKETIFPEHDLSSLKGEAPLIFARAQEFVFAK